MSSSKAQALIEAPVATVWELVGDPAHHPDWWPGVIDVKGERFDLGDEYVQVTRAMGSSATTNFLVERREDLREIKLSRQKTGTYSHWLMTEARQSHQSVVLTVGMKGLGWPEFYVPDALVPEGGFHDGQDLGSEPALDAAALVFVRYTVERYRLNQALVAWQVENEPFNRSGPNRLWVDGSFLKQEIATLKSLDRHRPVIVNAFTHFNLIVDQASDRNGFNVGELLGFDTDGAERDSLSALGKRDILGLDVYTAIGYQLLGQNHVSRADADWPDRLERLRGLAEKQGKQAWIMEAQAEPWEASYATLASPLSITPKDIAANFATLKDAGYTTILLWGSEYWLWRADHGDSRWVDTVKSVLAQEAAAPAISLPA